MKSIQKNSIMKGFFLFYAVYIEMVVAQGFDYQNVNVWPLMYPTCNGTRQSPMDINIYQLSKPKDDKKLEFQNYDAKPSGTSLTNNGHTISVNFEWNDKIPYVCGGPFSGKYLLDSIHFHWDSQNEKGSEHSLAGFKFPFEMHAVHFKSEYETFSNALDYDDGLVVIGGLWSLNPYEYPNEESPGLTKIVDLLDSIAYPVSSIDIDPFPAGDLLNFKYDNVSYIMYEGSLTTPPCTENVIWIISNYEYYLPKEQLEVFQTTVKFFHGDTRNWRDIQPANCRKSYIIQAE